MFRPVWLLVAGLPRPTRRVAPEQPAELLRDVPAHLIGHVLVSDRHRRVGPAHDAHHGTAGDAEETAVKRVAVLTDGAARLVTMFDLLDWQGVLDVLDQHGPTELIRRVRAIEAADSTGTKWPRNKGSDDATAVYAN